MIQNLKGFRDFFGVEAKKRAYVSGILESAFKQCGFELLQTPTLEYEELLLGKYGTEANKLIYSFTDRGERRVAMRYDQTVPTARAITQYQAELGLPYMRYSIAPVWRADKPQKGRYREFLQCDIDIFGSQSALADATILATTALAIGKFDVPYKIACNTRPNLIELIKNSQIPESLTSQVITILDKLDKKTTSEVLAELRELGLDGKICENLFTNIKDCKIPQDLQNILNLAKELGVPADCLEFNPSLARGLDYYTGLIFEVKLLGYNNGSVAGGGRYDNLINSLVGYNCQAVGMAIGFDRLVDALTDLGKIPQSINAGANVLITTQESTLNVSCQVAQELTKNNISFIMYQDPVRKLEAQYKYATAKNIPFIVIVPQNYAETKEVIIKNAITREQTNVKLSLIKSFFNS